MTRIPIVRPQEMEKLLLSLGFRAVRRRGSHVFYRHADGRTTTVPHHSSRDLARPLIREILREIELTPEEFKEALKRM
ncbi:MAG: type II toxin-antitoxin system HicA family toxin [Chloroflexi bacterium]|nr:type II toxin-antitoxin system HicA family toxin [Chloroflexota bacterium]